jgi:biopolymer transport protein ExbD
MAFSVGNGGTSTRRFRASYSMSEMNVVPLVDVVLVLLIIFMLTAQVMEFGLEIEVPVVKRVQTTTEELPVVSISRSGELQLNETPVNINELGAAIEQRFGANQAVYVRADREAVWDVVAQVIDALGRAGMQVNALMQPQDEAQR